MGIITSYVIVSGCLGRKESIVTQLRKEGFKVVSIPEIDAIIILNTTERTAKHVLEALGFSGGKYTEID